MEIDETFAPLDRAELLGLGQRRDGPGLLRLAIQVPWLVGSGALLVAATGPAQIGVLLVVHAVAQATFFAPLHECTHRTAFATRWLNDAVAWLAAIPQLTAPNGMRAFHFAHHRHTHDLAHDPELGGLEPFSRWPRGALLVLNTTGLPILLARTALMLFSAIGLWPDAVWRRVMPFATPELRSGVSWHSRALLALHVAALTAAVLVDPALFRLYAAVAVGHAVLSVYLVAEHRGLAMAGTVLERTRSFAGNPVVDFVMWNMPYHAEHHGWPGVPFHALPALHARVVGQLPQRGRRLLGLYASGG